MIIKKKNIYIADKPFVTYANILQNLRSCSVIVSKLLSSLQSSTILLIIKISLRLDCEKIIIKILELQHSFWNIFDYSVQNVSIGIDLFRLPPFRKSNVRRNTIYEEKNIIEKKNNAEMKRISSAEVTRSAKSIRVYTMYTYSIRYIVNNICVWPGPS